MIARVSLHGCTSTPAFSNSRSAATPMCSISTVTTSQSFANAMTSAASWNEPSVGIATMDAGDTGFGSRERTRTPMGAPAMASMRPS